MTIMTLHGRLIWVNTGRCLTYIKLKLECSRTGKRTMTEKIISEISINKSTAQTALATAHRISNVILDPGPLLGPWDLVLEGSW